MHASKCMENLYHIDENSLNSIIIFLSTKKF